ncbi:MAG: acyl carrier protein [Acidobacteriota bacterium]
MSLPRDLSTILTRITGLPESALRPERRWDELGLDSVALVEVLLGVQLELGVSLRPDELAGLTTLGELAERVQSALPVE